MTRYPEIILIAAVAKNGVIGRDNALPWRLKADMHHFKQTTMGHPLLMGRKTWQSLGRPLPGRRNLVVTRNAAFQADGAEVFSSIESALAAVATAEQVFVIGGGELYRRMLPMADRLVLTQIQADIDGDTCFPPFEPAQFHETARESHPADENNDYPYDFVEYWRSLG